MKNKPMNAHPSAQRGVVMIFSLIILLILTIGAVALMRSMNTSLISAGNLAFHRDLVNQGEQAVSTVVAAFKTDNLPTTGGITTADVLTSNYSSVALPTNAQGVPNALLLSTANFQATYTAPDLVGSTPDVTMRYVVDRLCSVTGPASIPICVQSSGLPTGGTANRNTAVTPPSATVYRLTVRVSGPRNTQTFLQTTFTKPD